MSSFLSWPSSSADTALAAFLPQIVCINISLLLLLMWLHYLYQFLCRPLPLRCCFLLLILLPLLLLPCLGFLALLLPAFPHPYRIRLRKLHFPLFTFLWHKLAQHQLLLTPRLQCSVIFHSRFVVSSYSSIFAAAQEYSDSSYAISVVVQGTATTPAF